MGLNGFKHSGGGGGGGPTDYLITIRKKKKYILTVWIGCEAVVDIG